MFKEKLFMKKFVAGVGAMALAVSMLTTGCSSTKDSKVSALGNKSSETKSSEASSKEETKDGLTTVKVGVWTGTSSQWFAELGQEKGIYEANGINVEITGFGTGIESVDQVVTGNLDIGFVADFAGVNRIGATQDMTDLKFIAPISTSNSWALYVNPDEVKSIEDLKGKGIIASLGTVIEYFNGITLEKAGLTKDDVNILPIESPTDVLALAKSGEAVAYWTVGETANKLRDEYGWEPIATQADFGMETYSLFMANNAYVSENTDTVQKFLKATEEINAYVAENKDEVVKLFADKYGVEESFASASIASADYDDEFTQEMYDGLQAVEKWCFTNGFFEKEYEMKDFINADALTAIDESKVSYK